MPVKIVYEDESFLCVDKPSGLVVHSDGRTDETSLTDFLEKNYPDLENIGNPHTLDSGRYTARWGIVNRLDRDTSGLVLIAKSDVAFLNLQKQFMERSIAKEYVAKTWNKPTTPGGLGAPLTLGGRWTITEPISRHKKDPRIWVCGTGVGERKTNRDAETLVIPFEVQDNFSKTMLLRLFPKTGRTHQLRLHCRFIGHPIVGDTKYGINGITNEHGTEQIDAFLEFLKSPQPPLKGGASALEKVLDVDKNSRLMLHAKSLEFKHPVTGLKIKIESELPKEFLN